ncbi:MAG: DUF1593 domain-containing protein [Bacteroidia bacterium]
MLITTDIGGDPDDTQSLIRYLVYANEFDTEGIIASASGTIGELDSAVVQPYLVHNLIRAYGEIVDNLRLHDPGYPSAESLLAVIRSGNPHRGWENIGEGHDTEASEWIIRVADKKDPRPLNICIWGGQTDVAQALWKVKNTRSPKAYRKFVAKIRLYDINDQDRIFGKMQEHFPGLFYILSQAPSGHDKREGGYRGIYLGGDESLTSREWIYEHVKTNHGPLGALYPDKTWTAPNPHSTMKEGDTPSWLYFLPNGLSDPAHPEYGSWGGRFEKHTDGHFVCAPDRVDSVFSARAAVWRWRPDFQADFASRMDRCVAPFSSVNHAPVAVVNGIEGKAPLIISARNAAGIVLDAGASNDPDNDLLSFEWLWYGECTTGIEAVDLATEGAQARISFSAAAKDYELHLVLKAKDNGSPALSSYRRIIIRP